MPIFKGNRKQNIHKSNSNTNFDNCLIYVKRTWPNESEDIQMIRAEAVYSISNVFFNEIIPKVMEKNLAFSLN